MDEGESEPCVLTLTYHPHAGVAPLLCHLLPDILYLKPPHHLSFFWKEEGRSLKQLLEKNYSKGKLYISCLLYFVRENKHFAPAKFKETIGVARASSLAQAADSTLRLAESL